MADPNEGIELAIAETYEVLGDPRAAMVRENYADSLPDYRGMLDDLLAALDDALMYIPAPSERHKHTAVCAKTRTVCLAERIRGIVGEYR